MLTMATMKSKGLLRSLVTWVLNLTQTSKLQIVSQGFRCVPFGGEGVARLVPTIYFKNWRFKVDSCNSSFLLLLWLFIFPKDKYSAQYVAWTSCKESGSGGTHLFTVLRSWKTAQTIPWTPWTLISLGWLGILGPRTSWKLRSIISS